MNKRNRKSAYKRRYNKPLIKGKFYRIMDSNGGHYSRLYKKIPKRINTGSFVLRILKEGTENFYFIKSILN